MAQKVASGFCPFEQKTVLAIANKPNHLLHFILTLVTAGIWLIVWILFTVGKIGNYKCSSCGRPISKGSLAPTTAPGAIGATPTMPCPHCGTTMNIGAKFCPKCGKAPADALT